MENDEDDDFFKTKAAKNLIKCFCLSITYASTIGGTASLIGILDKNPFNSSKKIYLMMN
jgi:hypothetical protein